MESVFILLALLANVWIWKIFLFSPTVFLVVLFATLLLLKLVTKMSALSFSFLVISLAVLTAYQVSPANISALTSLSNDQTRVRDTRMTEYPTSEILGVHFWARMAPLYEQSNTVRFVSRYENKVLDLVDPNTYFFASHPRERVGMQEFEKFSYVMLPVFIVGLFELYKKQRKLLAIFVLVILLFGFWNANTKIGPLVFFPFIAVSIYLGLKRSYVFVKKYKYHKLFIFGYLTIFILSLIQIVSYGLF